MLRKALVWLGIALLSALIAVAGVALTARFTDGPLGPFVGGPFVAGTPTASPSVDWKFVEPIANVELQLLSPARSRTTWIVHLDGQVYIPCGVPQFRLWKQWPHQALADGRGLLRVDGRVYPVELVKISDESVHFQVNDLLTAKYDAPTLDLDSLWIFRLDPRG